MSAHATLVHLGSLLRASGYAFVTVTPETHRGVLQRRPTAAGQGVALLRDVFGWNRSFSAHQLPAEIAEAARAAGVTEAADNGLTRATVRFATLAGGLLAHSGYPTLDHASVFFGPDTYRFCRLLETELGRHGVAEYLVDVGCGTGAGGIVGAAWAKRVVLSDVNEAALQLARANLALANLGDRVATMASDVLAGVPGTPDVIVANPPYIADPAGRAYRDGGGVLGADLGLRMVREAVARLAPGGRLILYTGAAVVEGADTFRAAVAPLLEGRLDWRYWEIDPDVFGEEIATNDAYASVERIAAVALVGRKPR